MMKTPEEQEFELRHLIDIGRETGMDDDAIRHGLVLLLDTPCPIRKVVVHRVINHMRGNEPLKFEMKGISQ